VGDLAEQSGISREYIARLETGHHDPSLSTRVKLAKALKVKVGECGMGRDARPGRVAPRRG